MKKSRHEYFIELKNHIKRRTGLKPNNSQSSEELCFEPGSYAQGLFDGGVWGWHEFLCEVKNLQIKIDELEGEISKRNVKDRLFGLLGAIDGL